MRQSDDIKELAAAMVKAQAEIKPALKDATNPHLKSKYADLASVWAAARETLGKHGLCVIQCPGKLENNTLELTTRLLHSSGQWLEDTISLPVVKLDAQTCGGAITYARRYSLSAMLGIVADDDDDGHSSTHGSAGQSRPQSQSRPAPAGARPAGGSVTAGANPAPRGGTSSSYSQATVDAPPPPAEEPPSGLFEDTGSGAGPCCAVCLTPVDDRVKAFSSQKYGRILCREHQREAGTSTPGAFR